jgi:hypothetical protein
MSTRYLFQRKGSQNWYVRLQPPGGKLVERSLVHGPWLHEQP